MLPDFQALIQALPPDPSELFAEIERLRRELERANGLLRLIPARALDDHVRRANGLPALSLARPLGGAS